jgi:hypothetical protein
VGPNVSFPNIRAGFGATPFFTPYNHKQFSVRMYLLGNDARGRLCEAAKPLNFARFSELNFSEIVIIRRCAILRRYFASAKVALLKLSRRAAA